jgi:hypothetical protein
MWTIGLMDKYNTFMWQEVKRDSWWRIQTDNPVVIRKLKRRKTATVCVWFLNAPTVIFSIQYKSPRLARQSLQRLTGQIVKKDALNDLFFADTSTILTSNNKPQTLKDKETS